jgi:hypothetical protein
MTKLTDIIKQALEKKQGKQNIEHTDAVPDLAAKAKKPVAPAISGKPVKKSSGRGR